MAKNNIIAFIPARGGSKRFPGKNIAKFLGKPLISYPIKEAKKSKVFNRIIVSTDNKKIAKVAELYGATITKRSKKNSSSKAHELSALKEYLLPFCFCSFLNFNNSFIFTLEFR